MRRGGVGWCGRGCPTVAFVLALALGLKCANVGSASERLQDSGVHAVYYWRVAVERQLSRKARGYALPGELRLLRTLAGRT